MVTCQYTAPSHLVECVVLVCLNPLGVGNVLSPILHPPIPNITYNELIHGQ